MDSRTVDVRGPTNESVPVCDEECYKQTGMLFTNEGEDTIVGDEKLTP